jgi:hypothetical protein
MALSKTTQNHEEIRRWAEKRGAVPAEVSSTHRSSEPGILRFSFPKAKGGRNNEKLNEISWDEFFEKFDESNLQLLYQEKTATGRQSNFNKLVHPATMRERSRSGGRASTGSRSGGRTSSTSGAGRTHRRAA